MDLRTGAEQPHSPVVITATYPGTGDGSSGSVLTFDAQKQNQRPALTLANGIVYVGWSSHCDWGPYHGWLIGYDATNLQQAVVYNDTPNGTNGGIWMSGQAPAVDPSGNLYLSTGNGTVGTTANRRDTTNRGESFLKLTRNGTNLTVASWFTPYNYTNLDNGDLDLGSAGILLIPGTTLAVSGGKQGTLYLVNRDNMGGLSGSTTADTNIIQSFSPGANQIHGGPVWWDGPDGSYAYIQAASDYLRQYNSIRRRGCSCCRTTRKAPRRQPAANRVGCSPYRPTAPTPAAGSSGRRTISSATPTNRCAPAFCAPTTPRMSPTSCGTPEQLSARDTVGNFAKFVPPTVANGKVYLATFSNRLNVYGLLPLPSLAISRAGATSPFPGPPMGLRASRCRPTATCFRPIGLRPRTPRS